MWLSKKASLLQLLTCILASLHRVAIRSCHIGCFKTLKQQTKTFLNTTLRQAMSWFLYLERLSMQTVHEFIACNNATGHPEITHLYSRYYIKLNSFPVSNTAQVLFRIVLLDGSLQIDTFTDLKILATPNKANTLRPCFDFTGYTCSFHSISKPYQIGFLFTHKMPVNAIFCCTTLGRSPKSNCYILLGSLKAK